MGKLIYLTDRKNNASTVHMVALREAIDSGYLDLALEIAEDHFPDRMKDIAVDMYLQYCNRGEFCLAYEVAKKHVPALIEKVALPCFRHRMVNKMYLDALEVADAQLPHLVGLAASLSIDSLLNDYEVILKKRVVRIEDQELANTMLMRARKIHEAFFEGNRVRYSEHGQQVMVELDLEANIRRLRQRYIHQTPKTI